MEANSRVMEKRLGPMFDRARRDGLYFYSTYQSLWFSPDELEADQAAGRFRWGAVNWELRHPSERTRELEHKVAQAQTELDAWRKRLKSEA